MNTTLEDKQKSIEKQESGRRFLPNVPVCARLDGKNFHQFTKGMDRPYDLTFSSLMIATTLYLVEETNACIGYTQSDEISLIYYSEKDKSQIFFDGRIQKMCSVLASMCSVKFNKLLLQNNKTTVSDFWTKKSSMDPIFDCRVWMCPNRQEAINNLIWRELDCTKNSITMAAQSFYPHKALMGKSGSKKQEMLHQKGINWNNYPVHFKRGTYVQRSKSITKFSLKEIEKLPPKHKARLNPDLMIERTKVDVVNVPPIRKIINLEEFVFSGKSPVEEKNKHA